MTSPAQQPSRPRVYPLHRAVVRASPSRWRLIWASLAALGLCTVVWIWLPEVVAIHTRILHASLAWTRFPQAPLALINIYGILPDQPMPAWPPAQVSRGAYIVVALCVAGLLVAYRRTSLVRPFIGLVSALVAAGILGQMTGLRRIDGAQFGQMWLRAQVVVWVLLPLVTGFLFMIPVRRAASGFLWMLGVQAAMVVWSALRLAFCLMLSHFTGSLLLAAAWFVFGLLADLLLVLVGYSLVLASSAEKIREGSVPDETPQFGVPGDPGGVAGNSHTLRDPPVRTGA
ncbi:MAG: hypothetical protein FJW40_10955 [Acidobacteria bacterium]|nr:hypothetical protein [Acidobacteriota bacterium]